MMQPLICCCWSLSTVSDTVGQAGAKQATAHLSYSPLLAHLQREWTLNGLVSMTLPGLCCAGSAWSKESYSSKGG
jgi:hypothetical protein